jgi:hypothetical protein
MNQLVRDSGQVFLGPRRNSSPFVGRRDDPKHRSGIAASDHPGSVGPDCHVHIAKSFETIVNSSCTASKNEDADQIENF